MKHFRFDGSHVEDLDDGRTVEPGQIFELTPDAAALPRATALIENGLLVELAGKPSRRSTTEKETD
jgi:hypothetical protein